MGKSFFRKLFSKKVHGKPSESEFVKQLKEMDEIEIVRKHMSGIKQSAPGYQLAKHELERRAARPGLQISIAALIVAIVSMLISLIAILK
jgi:hypothetical protein